MPGPKPRLKRCTVCPRHFQPAMRAGYRTCSSECEQVRQRWLVRAQRDALCEKCALPRHGDEACPSYLVGSRRKRAKSGAR